jgi:anthranilate phosphoribosyltransferase
MSYALYISNLAAAIGTGAELSEQEAYDLFGAMLDGGVADLELGALLIALHVKRESLAELLGFARALDERTCKLHVPAGSGPPVLLPCYSGEGLQAAVVPLLALLLVRFRIPVLIHGELNSRARVPAAYVLRELGVMPCASAVAAQQELDAGRVAFVPTAVLAPGLAALLSLRDRLGIESSPQMMAKMLEPFGQESVRMIRAHGAACAEKVSDLLLATGATALLLNRAEPEARESTVRRPSIQFFQAGCSHILFDPENGHAATASSPAPVLDAARAAATVRAAIAGHVQIPLPVVNQLACCLFAAGYAADLNQAKAIVALKKSWPVAA